MRRCYADRSSKKGTLPYVRRRDVLVEMGLPTGSNAHFPIDAVQNSSSV